MKDRKKTCPSSLYPALTLMLVVTLMPWRVSALDEPPEQATYSMEATVRVRSDNPTLARVRWKFAGIDEVQSIRLGLRGNQFHDFSGTGTLEETGPDEILWTPRSPYGHLEYSAPLHHKRAPNKGFDAFATDKWAIVPSRMLFPSARLSVDRRIEPNPVPKCEVRFVLPKGWQAWSSMKPIASNTYRPDRSGRLLDRPHGWIAMGKMIVNSRTISGTRIQIVRTPESNLPSKEILKLYSKTLPMLQQLHANTPKRLLIVSAGDPMWRGGISGKQSIFLHGDRPLRTRDQTSPALHEAFHVLAPFLPGPDGRWVTEGLAEYYSLALQHRAGILSDQDFNRGLELFFRHGQWNVDLTRLRTLAATNNSAPLIMHALDAAIRKVTDSSKTLDDVVQELAQRSQQVTTAGLLGSVRSVTNGQNFTVFFQWHIFSGRPPVEVLKPQEKSPQNKFPIEK